MNVSDLSMYPPSRVVTAVHEAGHAVVACKLNRPTRYVTIRPKDKSLGGHVLATPRWPKQRILRLMRGEVTLRDVEAIKADAAKEIIIGFAGWVAENIFLNQANKSFSNTADFYTVSDAIKCFGLTPEAEKEFLEKKLDQTVKILVSNRRKVLLLAKQLLEHKTIKRKQVYEIVNMEDDPELAGLGAEPYKNMS